MNTLVRLSGKSDRGAALHRSARAGIERVAAVAQIRGSGAVMFLAIAVVVFQSMSGNFLSSAQLQGVFMLAASVGCIAAGVTLLMISGEFDLSVGATYALIPIIMGTFVNRYHFNIGLAFATAMACAVVVGLVNGLATTRLRIPSFIATLASLFVITAVGYMITSGLPVARFQHSAFDHVLGGTINGGPLNAPFLWAVGAALVLWFVHSRTRYGNWCRAAAAPGNAGRALGVPVTRVKLINFVICSSLSGFAGCCIFMQLGSVDSSYGTDNNLLAIVAAVLGGASLFGVEGSVLGAFVGALTLGSIDTGLVLVGAPASWYQGLIGLLLVIAVLVNERLGAIAGTVSRKFGRGLA